MAARVHLAVRGLLIVATLVIGLAWLAVGRVEATPAELEQAIADGRVDAVELVGGLEQPFIGFATIEARWRLHGIGRTTRLTEVHCRDGGTACRAALGADEPRYPDVAAALQALEPDLRITEVRDADRASDAVGVAADLMRLLFVLALILGPAPRLATKWAWFWLSCAVPWLVPAVYAAVAGPWRLSGRSGAREPAPPVALTGGPAFLLGIVISAVLTAVAGPAVLGI